eukprot:TRINITY_DN19342_c0_g1_i1.p1 TRINITY_DN19342_c0_g1~~TRINITY_DN19342_c0_g1_i1.p1  ORF type:complete len:269 (+),score=65.71 TRINITY_DN19342_c0_g1_i1:196-1002(+)
MCIRDSGDCAHVLPAREWLICCPGEAWPRLGLEEVIEQLSRLQMDRLCSLMIQDAAEHAHGTPGIFARALARMMCLELPAPVRQPNLPLSSVSRLILSHPEHVDDQMLLLIAAHMPRVLDLYVRASDNVSVTNTGLAALASSCPLRVLALASDSVTDAGVAALAGSCGSTLKYLYMRGENLTQAGLVALSRRCTALRVTELPYHMLYTDTADILSVILNASGHWGSCDCEAVCLLYTSDAADEEDSVDLGGRRIIKKKKKKKESRIVL